MLTRLRKQTPNFSESNLLAKPKNSATNSPARGARRLRGGGSAMPCAKVTALAAVREETERMFTRPRSAYAKF